jgi:carbon-monoxide dehydrogenase small subunit
MTKPPGPRSPTSLPPGTLPPGTPPASTLSRRIPPPRSRVEPTELVDVPLTVNGSAVTVRVPARMHLADALREHLGLTGTHLGCEHGVCGMCTVLVDGEAARACLLFAVQCEGAEVITVEGLGSPGEQHPLQRAFAAHHALQCGFCTPGMLLSGYDLLANGPAGTAVAPERLPVEMSGVLCRCTGYRGILAAVADVAAACPAGVPGPGNCAPRPLLGRRGGGTGAGAAAPPDSEPRPAPAHPEPELPAGAPSATVEVRSMLSAPVEAVWRVLDDFERLARCLPGATLVEVLDDGRHLGRAVVALGPVKLSFDGVARVVERDAGEHRLRVLARGADAGGSATQADIRLHAARAPDNVDGGTVLSADASLYLSGRIAQFGRALAGDVSHRLFEQFAAAVERAALTGEEPAEVAAPSPVRLILDVLVRRLRTAFRRRPR